ncbi:MAG: phosphoenolpyruvate--protein phosphotransferase [Hyphomicrobiales bacterium]
MPGAMAGPRLLLRSLRATMAESIGAQERLDKVATLIASNMVAEVCSIYALRADRALELYATEGLNKDAVHKTTLRVGEGLVGLIAADARPLNLPEARNHPQFAYRPETGEDMYHSFMGVPILRAGRTLGVLVVQNETQRSYEEDEVEALQTTAMVIAEVLASEELSGLSGAGGDLDIRQAHHFAGTTLCDGIGLGTVVLHEQRVVVTDLIAEDVDTELRRLDASIASLRLSVDDMLARGDMATGGAHRDVLEAYRMFANDQGWVRRIKEAVQSGLTAEAAVERVQNQTRVRMKRQANDPYLLDRLHDFEDLANRLLRVLMGKPQTDMNTELPENAVLVARTMGAAELLDYDRGNLRGLVLEEGAPTSHVSIVARALGLPSIGRAQDVVALAEAGDDIIIDGDAGEVHLRPSSEVVQAYGEKVKFRAKRMERFRENRNLPSVSKDGVPIEVLMNAGLLVDMDHLEEAGAVGIGLFRTELQFMVASSFPKMAEQQALYEQVLDHANGKPVTFRSIDVGGDKVLPYLRMDVEENPAMGWRAIRLGLDRPGLMRAQLRALLLAAKDRELRLMFPMITEVQELRKARTAVAREIEHVKSHYDVEPPKLQLGAMLEVPSLLFQLEELFDVADFVSVGSNDLLQFMTASDRGNTRVAERFDPLGYAYMRALKRATIAAKDAGKTISLCGDLAGRPLEAMALIGIGFRQISMSPAQIGPVKEMLRALPVKALEDKFSSWLNGGLEGRNLRGLLEDFAKAHQVPY